jgi:hypothetical protein
MNEETQAPPEGPDLLPSRPPSPPSRVPRLIWAGIALFCLLMFGAAVAVFLWSREATGSRDLKKATSLTISYTLKGNQAKSVTVSDPAEVRDLLDALEITGTQPGMFMGLKPAGRVDFVLPDGTVARTTFADKTDLDRANWGQVYVTPRFYEKVCDVASKTEGRKIDVLRMDN